MKQFLKYVSLFILPILVLALSCEILLRNIPNDYIYKRKYLDKNAQNIDILFLGSSHVFYGIDPRFIHAPSFNASYVSQTLNYDFEILVFMKPSIDSNRPNAEMILLPESVHNFP